MGQGNAGRPMVSFTQMSDGTREDYALLQSEPEPWKDDLATRLLKELDSACDVESPHQISRLGHSLQTATRALRDDADEEMVVVALLHDVGDRLAPASGPVDAGRDAGPRAALRHLRRPAHRRAARRVAARTCCSPRPIWRGNVCSRNPRGWVKRHQNPKTGLYCRKIEPTASRLMPRWVRNSR